MRTILTCHPINKPLMKSLGIYDSCYVEARDVGEIMHVLIANGYKNIYAFEVLNDNTDS